MKKKENPKETTKKENMKKENIKKENIKQNKKSTKPKKKRKIFRKILLFFVVLIIILAGVCAGLIFGLTGGEYAITKNDLIIDYSNSMVFDQEGNMIATLSAKENRKILTKSEMGDYLPKAFVAIEDKRFYSHHGVDLKRTGGALVSYILRKGEGTASGGGSTITQQLVKNITNEKEDSGVEGAVRKVKEMVRAYQVENILSKDQILELYMNVIFLGGNVYGVGMASQYYFSKDAEKLDIAESAYIAGITHSPNYYNPFGKEPKKDKIEARTKTVLFQMKDQGKINEEEYKAAVEEVEKGLNFKQGKGIDKASYSSHTEAMVRQIINQLVNEKGMDKEYAETYLYSSGFKIYSTEKNAIQKALEKEYAKDTYRVKTTVTKTVDGKSVKEKETAQSAMVVIDHTTGQVVGAVGVLGEKGAGELNRVTQAWRQPGSSIKPIGVYGPALQEGVINAASVYDDAPVKFGNYAPGNAYSGFKGLTNMRQAIRVSSNTVAVQVMKDLTPTRAINFMKKLGITSLSDSSDNSLPLALGGISWGITPLEMAGAYASIANNGEYITPTFFLKVEDSDGNIVIEPKQEKERVFSEQNAYILKELLTEPTKSGGTATKCKISNMETAAKTGTTNSKKDKWLCGFTSYYTAATWYGYDTPTAIPNGATNNAINIWKNVMSAIHKDLKGKNFVKPDGVVSVNVCKDSGLLASDLCKNDPRGSRVYSELFVKGTAPKKTCSCHVEAEICKDTEKVANEFCTNIEKRVYITRATDKTNWKSTGDAKYMLPKDTCTQHSADKVAPVITLNGASTINLTVGATYTEQGAKATDDRDGDITAKIITTVSSGKVNTAVAGTYIVTYTVSDTAGNTATATRTVKVTTPTTPTTPSTPTNTNTITNTTPAVPTAPVANNAL